MLEIQDHEVATLREGAWEVATASSEEWLSGCAEVLASCQVLDASEAFSYFWDETPNEETFDMKDIPGICLPEALAGSGEGKQALFVEAEAPAKGLGWSMLLDGRGTPDNEMLRHINSVAYPKGIATAAVGTDPGAMIMEPGLVERAGALVCFDDNPGLGGSCKFYERLAESEELEHWQSVVRMLPFVALDAGLYGDTVQPPQVIYYLPIGSERRVRPVTTDEGVPMVIPGFDPATEDAESIGGVLGRGHRPLQLAVLFSLACAGARKGHRHASPSVRQSGKDACGSVSRLAINEGRGNLRASLDGLGNARDLGLAHALTVCRGEFSDEKDEYTADSGRGKDTR